MTVCTMSRVVDDLLQIVRKVQGLQPHFYVCGSVVNILFSNTNHLSVFIYMNFSSILISADCYQYKQ